MPSGKAGYAFAHPGYAWAATRPALERLGGLLDMAALGAGDHHMALVLIGRAEESLLGGIHRNHRRAVMRWQERAMQHSPGNLGYVPGTIEHQWHGSKELRKYVDRWETLIRNRFDPVEDLTSGLLELAGNKPAFGRDIIAICGSGMRMPRQSACCGLHHTVPGLPRLSAISVCLPTDPLTSPMAIPAYRHST